MTVAELIVAGALALGNRTVVTLPSREQAVVTPADVARGIPQMIEHDTLVDRKNGRDVRLPIKYFYICRDSEVQHYLDWLETLPRDKRGRRDLGWDTETSGIFWWKEKIATEQFGNPKASDPRAYTIDVRCLSKGALALVMAPVDDPLFVKLGQNIKFECLYAMHHLGARPKCLIDTQVTELVLRAGLFPGGDSGDSGDGQNRKAYGQCSMKNLVLRRLGGIDIDKDHDLRVSFYVTPPGQHDVRQIIYAGADTILPFYIFDDQRKDIDARALRSTLAVEFELIPVLADMEIRGMAFDQPAWLTLWQEAVARQAVVERQLDKLFLSFTGDLFNGAVVDETPATPCTVCGGSGKRLKRVECEPCGGTGRTRSNAVRPLYTAGKGKNAKPGPLNWGSSAQVKWAIRQYCGFIDWPVKLLTTDRQLLDVKKQLGLNWLTRKGIIAFNEDGQLIDPKTKARLTAVSDEIAEDIPDFVVPEQEYCILLGTDADLLKLRKLRGQLPKELIDLILEYSETKSRIGTFGIDFLNNVHPDGRVRFEFHQVLASTGRLSASPNSMNIPRDRRYRDAFVAAAKKRLCISDYSQQEPRVSAFVSGDEVYTRNYLTGGDLYVTIAEEMLGYRPDVHSEDAEFQKRSKKDRQAVKATALGLAYRMGKGKLRDKLTLDMDEPISFEYASEQHNGYLERCAGIKVFQELCFAKADPASPSAVRIWDDMLGAPVTFIESPCGRKRFFAPDAKNVYTESSNLPIQGCGATMLKSAMCLIARELETRNWIGRAYLVNAVHDELVMEADEDIAVECAAMMKACMERAGSYYVGTIPMIAEFPTPDGTSTTWVKG